ncbi:MAG: VOC family protein [Verrucomicrobiae bacterium]|nr:VOC family protein [Verrucomicrobiae bacterium]
MSSACCSPSPVTVASAKFHVALNVADLGRSVNFYRLLLGCEPAKHRRDYAKFEIADPPLVLSLNPGMPAGSGALNHFGLRVPSSEILVAIQRRLELGGIRTRREDGVACCYALQTKFWVADPNETLWEIYVLHEDIDDHGHAAVPTAGELAALNRRRL